MKLRFIYTPVTDLKAARAFYVDVLGASLLWEEGASTCGVQLPGDHVPVMLDEDPDGGVAGPFYVVPSVHRFIERNPSITFLRGPERISPGWYASFADPDGNLIRIMDDTESKERVATERREADPA